jgi:hypothetical protein
MGITQTSDIDNCAIRVIDDTNFIFFLQIPGGSYCFFKDIVKVACVDQGDGVFNQCGADTPFAEVVPLEMDLDTGKSMDIIHQEGDVAGSTKKYQNPFEDLFKDKLSSIITVVVIIIVVIIILIVVIIGLKCVCGLVKSRLARSSTKIRIDPPRDQELSTSVVPTIGGCRTE